jgi:hypothetical protein
MRISNLKIFGLHPKVMLPQPFYAGIFVEITLVGPTKVSIMKLKHTILNRMGQHDFWMKQIFFSSIFLSENTGQLAKQAGYPGHNFWHTLYNVKTCKTIGKHSYRTKELLSRTFHSGLVFRSSKIDYYQICFKNCLKV